MTGGSGKIGAYVVRELAASHAVTVFDRAPPADTKETGWIGGDIENFDDVLQALARDDSTAAEPLCDLLPRLMPALGKKARTLTGDRPGVTNERAKRLLQWQPRYSWCRAE